MDESLSIKKRKAVMQGKSIDSVYQEEKEIKELADILQMKLEVMKQALIDAQLDPWNENHKKAYKAGYDTAVKDLAKTDEELSKTIGVWALDLAQEYHRLETYMDNSIYKAIFFKTRCDKLSSQLTAHYQAKQEEAVKAERERMKEYLDLYKFPYPDYWTSLEGRE